MSSIQKFEIERCVVTDCIMDELLGGVGAQDLRRLRDWQWGPAARRVQLFSLGAHKRLVDAWKTQRPWRRCDTEAC
ncbi:MAG: hypothetical protein ACREC1_02040 [Methylovirgula sp.]